MCGKSSLNNEQFEQPGWLTNTKIEVIAMRGSHCARSQIPPFGFRVSTSSVPEFRHVVIYMWPANQFDAMANHTSGSIRQ